MEMLKQIPVPYIIGFGYLCFFIGLRSLYSIYKINNERGRYMMIDFSSDFYVNDSEKQHYIDEAIAETGVSSVEDIKKIKLTQDGDDVIMDIQLVTQPKFERIRRITGYLTGNLDSWNNAKRAEEHDRVKHA